MKRDQGQKSVFFCFVEQFKDFFALDDDDNNS